MSNTKSHPICTVTLQRIGEFCELYRQKDHTNGGDETRTGCEIFYSMGGATSQRMSGFCEL